jgi:hypothetical protein
MKMELDEFQTYVKWNLPNSKSISHMEVLKKANAIKFKWNKHEFIVKNDLTTLELKRGNKLFITGTSALIQQALTSTNSNSKSIEKICELLADAEGKVVNVMSRNRGLETLAEVERILEKMIKKIIL